jgi:hypothetical protein
MFGIKPLYLEENDGSGNDLPGDPPAGDPPAPDAGDPPAGDPPAAPAAGDPPAGDPPGVWGDDWRAKMDKEGKHEKTLSRFASPNAIFESYIALRQKVDSGELKAVSPYPEKGKPEEQVAWRKAHGIPEAPEGYTLKFSDGLVIGDADKPIVDDFLKAAHATNATPEQVNGMLHWYYTTQENGLRAREEADTEYLRQSEDTLRAEWGGEYRTNINIIRGLVDTMPEAIRDQFMSARLGDGTALMNNPDMARWLVHNARTINPVATVVPGAGANMAQAIDDEISSIEKVMRTDRKAYNNDQKMQARLRELYDARAKAK